jgi:hypothetical protein
MENEAVAQQFSILHSLFPPNELSFKQHKNSSLRRFHSPFSILLSYLRP